MSAITIFLIAVGFEVLRNVILEFRLLRKTDVAQRQQIENNIFDAIDKGLISPEMPVAEAARILARIGKPPSPDVGPNDSSSAIKPAR